MPSDLEIFLQEMNLSLKDIKGIRMTRWGHAIPVAHTNLLASKKLDLMNQSINDRIFFAKPAFETALAAEIATNEI